MEAITLGIDLATASARCVAIDGCTGAVLARAHSPLPAPVRSVGGVSRQAADYAAVAFGVIATVCRELASAAARVGALSVTGTSGTVVGCDPRGRPLADARLYDDRSSAGVVTALGVAGGSSLGRMISLQNEIRSSGHEGPVLMRSTVDVVAAALVAGVVASDTSHALKAGIDLRALTWPLEVMTSLGLETAALPELVPPGRVIGLVSPDVAAALGLPTGVCVVSGMTDGCTAQLSTGAIRAGDSMGVLGTTLVLKAVSAVEVRTADGSVYSHLSPAGDFWPGGASSSGAGVLDTEFARRDLGELDAAAFARGPSTVVRYPLARVGERFPVADPTLHSLSSGVPVDEVDAYRAVLEGVAFVERLGLETLSALGVRPHRHLITGGATRSATWNTIRATVLAPLLLGGSTGSAGSAGSAGEEGRDGLPGEAGVGNVPDGGSAVGAAILAALGLAAAGTNGQPPSLTTTVARLVESPVPVPPDPHQTQQLDQSYGVFLALIGANAPTNQTTSSAEQSAEGRPHHV